MSIFKMSLISAVRFYFSLVFVIVITACHSDDDIDLTINQLYGMDWQAVQGSVSLNNEIIDGASAEFENIPDSDELMLRLYGVHPVETIEIKVTATSEDPYNITFKGENSIENARHLKVEGIYSTHNSDSITLDRPCLQINITYDVPDTRLTRAFVIPFDSVSGFRHISDYGTYPLAQEYVEAQRDSCEFICQKINHELGENIRSLTLKFNRYGEMDFSCMTSQLEESNQPFRYWIQIEESTGKRIIEIENPDGFYECVMKAMGITSIKDDYPSISQAGIGHIFIEESNSELNYRIIFLDELHYEIFSLFYDRFQELGVLPDNAREYFDLMYKFASAAYHSPEYMVKFKSYRWAFENCETN